MVGAEEVSTDLVWFILLAIFAVIGLIAILGRKFF